MTDSEMCRLPLKDVMAKFGKQLDGSRKTRKARRKVCDGRRRTAHRRRHGRTEQFNFRSVPA